MCGSVDKCVVVWTDVSNWGQLRTRLSPATGSVEPSWETVKDRKDDIRKAILRSENEDNTALVNEQNSNLLIQDKKHMRIKINCNRE